MAGIGEATAIVAVAQAGISLSMAIISYVSDARDAPGSILRIGNEIKSTSGRLEEIAEIIKDNASTRLLLDTAVGDATRCSSDCELILAQVGNLLVKGGWGRDPTGLSKDDIDTSVFAYLRWPFLKTRLDTPRAELQRIKADLCLLFNVAMARKSSNPLENAYAQKIPLLTKKKEKAARRLEEARHRARESQDNHHATRIRSPRASSRRITEIAEEDPELSQRFLEFELQSAKEQEDRTMRERAALLQAEKDRKAKAEEDQQREIAQNAVEDYRLQQEKLKAQTTARDKQLSGELLGLGLGRKQINSILAVPSLNVDNIRSNVIESQRTSPTEVAGSPRPHRKRRGGFPIKFLPWGDNHKSKLSDSESNPVESNLQQHGSCQYKRETDSQGSIELWLVDVFSRQHTELALSEPWMSQKMRRIEKSNDVWHRFAQLQPMWRVVIQEFLKARNEAQKAEHAWKIIHIGLPRRMTKLSMFGHHHGGQLVRLMLSRTMSAVQAVNIVFVLKSGTDETLPSTVRKSTYLPRQLVSIFAIRGSRYEYKETFEVPAHIPELREVTDKTYVMISEALTAEQVDVLASLTCSMQIVSLKAKLSFVYKIIEKQAHDDGWKGVYGHSGPGPNLTPAHELLENTQRGRRADSGPGSSRELRSKIEGSIEYLEQQRSDIGESPTHEDLVWLHEIDARISVLKKRLANLDPTAAKTKDSGYDDDPDGMPSQSHSKPYSALVARPSEKEISYREHGERGSKSGSEDDLDLRIVDTRDRPGSVSPHTQLSLGPRRERLSNNHGKGSLEPEGLDRKPRGRTRRMSWEDDDKTTPIRDENDTIQYDEKKVLFEVRDHRKRYSEKADSRDRDDRLINYQPREGLGKRLEKQGYEYGGQIQLPNTTRPEKNTKVDRKHLGPDTLNAYQVPWEWMKGDSKYIVIRGLIPKADQRILFEHEKKLQEMRLSIDAKQKTKDYKGKSDVEWPKRDMSSEREDTWSNGRKSQALVLCKPRGRYSSHDRSSRKPTYDEEIRIGAAHDRPQSRPHPPLSSKSRTSTSYKLCSSSDGSRDRLSNRPPMPLPSSSVAWESLGQASSPVELSDDDEEDDDFHETTKDDQTDLIAKALSRYTTFKVDEDVIAGAKSSLPTVDATESSMIRESRSTTPRYPLALEDRKLSWENMQMKKSQAEDEGNIATAFDLHYRENPKMQRVIKEWEDEASMRADAKAQESENVGGAYGLQASQLPLHSVPALPTTAEDGVSGDQNPFEEAQKVLPRSGIHWHGIHDDSATEEQKDCSGGLRLKNVKSADDIRTQHLGDTSDQPANLADYTGFRTNQNTRNEKSKEEHTLTQSPSQSESEREPVGRVGTRFNKTESELSRKEKWTCERRNISRKTTVEDESINENSELELKKLSP